MTSQVIFYWWGRLELNQLPSGYEPPALTDELRPQTFGIIAYFTLLGYMFLINQKHIASGRLGTINKFTVRSSR